jgi:hypothetical protein
MKRRTALALLSGALCSLVRAQRSIDIAALLRSGACVFLLRHAETEAGIGDPASFKLNDCSTQRNLSESGREQSRRIGLWFKRQQL